MISIQLDTPADGEVIDAPLGASAVVICSGSFDALIDDPELLIITVMVDGQSIAASVDLDNRTFRADVKLNSPSTHSIKAWLLTRVWIEATHGQTAGHWQEGTRKGSNTATVSVRSTVVDEEFNIRCRCVDSANSPLVGLQIEAFDQDPKSPDDKLGGTFLTDVDGYATFSFRRSDFTEHSGERNPDVYFKLSLAGNALSYDLPRERNDRGVMRNFAPHSHPVIIHVAGARGFVVRGPMRSKWLSLGAHLGFLGRPLSDETPTPGGGGLFNHFEGGSIYWTKRWGAFEVHGLIRQKWADLGWEQGFLGFPVSDELVIPDGTGGRYSLFEHGVVTWYPGQAEAVAGPHHYERIYSQVRAQILGRFFAIGGKGRRNHLSTQNRLLGPVQTNPTTPVEIQEAERARWRIVECGGENPWMLGALLHTALAIELDAGNPESERVLSSALQTRDTLFTWAEPGMESVARLPVRWDAGLPIDKFTEKEQFLDGGNGTYANALPASHWHHHARRDPTDLERWLGPTAAALYQQKQYEYIDRYRRWELSMDEMTGLVTSCWIIGKLAVNKPDILGPIQRQASWLGNYLADNAYMLVRPMRGLSWRGATGILPALEHPFSRALGAAAGGADFTSRTDFRGAMERAGYWPLIEDPIASAQVAGWVLPFVLPLLGPVGLVLGTTVGGLGTLIATLGISPGTVFGALAVLQNTACFDIKPTELEEVAAALMLSGVPNKALAYRAFVTGQAEFANWRSYSVSFHSWIGLTGLDDADSTVRDTFRSWFYGRQSHPELEQAGMGSRTLFASGVAALIINDRASEEHLVALFEQAIVELFRESYFAPHFPVKEVNGQFYEICGPSEHVSAYSPLDLMAGLALAFWHAKRSAQRGTPVSTPRFPELLLADRFLQWPRIALPVHCRTALAEVDIPIEAIQGNSNPVAGPDGYALFDLPLVPRRPAQAPTHAWGVATKHVCDITVSVGAASPGDVFTGVTLHPGCEIQIDADGQLWGGGILDPHNGPNGLPRLINDAHWPLHTGLDPRAKAFCLLGRLNGYFRLSTGMVRSQWVYHEPRPLFLRINDDQPGDGSGQFNVRIQVWAPENIDASAVFRPVNVLRDGGVMRTSEKADLIEVSITPAVVPGGAVEFVLNTPNNITWRKEIVIRETPAVPGDLIATEDATHAAANGLYENQLAGATLTFRKNKGIFGGGMQTVAVLRGLDVIASGSRVTFSWVHD
jgi:hypothetical protein